MRETRTPAAPTAESVALITSEEFARLEKTLVPARKQLYQLIQSIDRRTGR